MTIYMIRHNFFHRVFFPLMPARSAPFFRLWLSYG